MFKGKVVVITGAGSGIGRALATELAPLGSKLALADINSVALAETMHLLPAGTDAKAYPLDVSSREAVFKFAVDVRADFGAAHVLFNNAGTGVFATVENTEIDEIEKVLNINLWGTIYGTKAFLPIMLAQKEGCIVNISSGFGLIAAPCQAAYCMSKFAVRALAETLWHELPGTGVRSVVVHPGGINTNIAKNSLQARHTGELEQKLMKGVGGKLTTTPQDCARQIIRGLQSGKNRLLVGSGAKTTMRLARLLPNRYGKVLRYLLGF
jgi:NAD(P)-dependent dehydrogenase (short-subunit alcohol dehydrogenase family)